MPGTGELEAQRDQKCGLDWGPWGLDWTGEHSDLQQLSSRHVAPMMQSWISMNTKFDLEVILKVRSYKSPLWATQLYLHYCKLPPPHIEKSTQLQKTDSWTAAKNQNGDINQNRPPP